MFESMKREMEETLRLVGEELKLIKTGRAKPSMIEGVEIEAYPGQRMRLIELASLNAPDPHLLVVQPWDQSLLEKIEKGLRQTEMNLSPVVEGNMIRIPVPALTEERRKEMVKLVHQKIESGRQMLREVRNKTKKEIESQEGAAGVSEDDVHQWLEDMQKQYDGYLQRMEQMGEDKESELMTI